MGREIRKVTPNWQHPKRSERNGDYQPMHDEIYLDAVETFLAEVKEYHKDVYLGNSAVKNEDGTWASFDDCYCGPPDPVYYRPAWTDEERTHFQIYETVSEGTPVSPVFASLEDMKAWMIENGTSEKAAQHFIENGGA